MSQETLPIVHQFTIPISENEEIRMALKQYKEQYYADIRHWFRDPGTDSVLPTRRGAFIPATHLPELKEGIHQLSQAFMQLPGPAASGPAEALSSTREGHPGGGHFRNAPNEAPGRGDNRFYRSGHPNKSGSSQGFMPSKGRRSWQKPRPEAS